MQGGYQDNIETKEQKMERVLAVFHKISNTTLSNRNTTRASIYIWKGTTLKEISLT